MRSRFPGDRRIFWGCGRASPEAPTFWFDRCSRASTISEESVLGATATLRKPGLLGFLAAWAVLAAPPSGDACRWRALTHHERVLWAFAGANLLLFALVPPYTSLVGEVHIRHAVIGTAVLPLLAARGGSLRRARRATAALAILAVITIAIAWDHLIRFDREARGFDQVVERIPYGARLVALIWDANGAVMRTKPYWHFGAYAQARRGGCSHTFPRIFRNLPVRMRADLPIPETPIGLDAKPYLFDYQAFGYAYDHVLVRMGETKGRDRFPEFPYQLVFEAAPWQLWRALPRVAGPPESLEAGRLGSVSLFRPSQPRRGFVFLFSDVGGFDSDLAQAARTLAAQGVGRGRRSRPTPRPRGERRRMPLPAVGDRGARSASSASSASRATAAAAGRIGRRRDARPRGARPVAGGDGRRRRLRRPRAANQVPLCPGARRTRSRRAFATHPSRRCPPRRNCAPGETPGARLVAAISARPRRAADRARPLPRASRCGDPRRRRASCSP
jgi:hypothetical protein